MMKPTSREQHTYITSIPWRDSEYVIMCELFVSNLYVKSLDGRCITASLTTEQFNCKNVTFWILRQPSCYISWIGGQNVLPVSHSCRIYDMKQWSCSEENDPVNQVYLECLITKMGMWILWCWPAAFLFIFFYFCKTMMSHLTNLFKSASQNKCKNKSKQINVFIY